MTVHGNLCGRGTGYRLVVDKNVERYYDIIFQMEKLQGMMISRRM